MGRRVAVESEQGSPARFRQVASAMGEVSGGGDMHLLVDRRGLPKAERGSPLSMDSSTRVVGV